MSIRSICLVDRIHADCALYLAKVFNGSLEANDTTLLFDVTPAAAIEEAADHLFKNHALSSFHYSIDGRGGWLGVNSSFNAELRNAMQDLCSGVDAVADEETPQINMIKHLEYKQINHLSEEHATLHAQIRKGVKPKKGDGWLVIDIVPATTALWLANEAVTCAQVAISDVKCTGSSGKIFLIGESEQLTVVQDLLEELNA